MKLVAPKLEHLNLYNSFPNVSAPASAQPGVPPVASSLVMFNPENLPADVLAAYNDRKAHKVVLP